ncbi:hypothetical protein BGX31_003798, partial [Mortierella sp. GBA43]
NQQHYQEQSDGLKDLPRVWLYDQNTTGGTRDSARTLNGIPTMGALTQDRVEETLRNSRFGYRARYIASIVKTHNIGEWLMGLRKQS